MKKYKYATLCTLADNIVVLFSDITDRMNITKNQSRVVFEKTEYEKALKFAIDHVKPKLGSINQLIESDKKVGYKIIKPKGKSYKEL